MNDKLRLAIAATVTALFLGAMSAGGLLSHAPSPRAATSSPAQVTVIHTPISSHEND